MRLDPLGDEISAVEIIDHMGDDLMVVNAARVSFAKYHEEFEAGDAKLIHYLAEHNHWTPFGHPQLQFRIKMPLFVAREWYRHTVGFVRNEVSRRYVDSEPEFFIPTTWRKKHENKKQGSGEEIVPSEIFDPAIYYDDTLNNAVYNYRVLIDRGVAPEMARTLLPQSMYTEFIETASLYAYARLCNLRISPDAQQETRKYAVAISRLIEPLFPVSWKELVRGSSVL